MGIFMISGTAGAQDVQRPGAIEVESTFTQQYDQWTARQWKALRKQLLQSLKAPAEQADPTVLQNVIYFATYFADEIRIDRAAPRILEIYRTHPQPEVRLMALSALHALGDPETMVRLARIVPFEEAGTVRHVGIAAVSDYYQRHE